MKAFVVLLVIGIIAAVLYLNAAPATAPEAAAADGQPAAPADALAIRIVYGSEKQAWLEEVTRAFNARRQQVAGRPVFVEAVAKGSGELIDDVLAGRDQADLVSPASAAFITLANAQSRAATGDRSSMRSVTCSR